MYAQSAPDRPLRWLSSPADDRKKAAPTLRVSSDVNRGEAGVDAEKGVAREWRSFARAASADPLRGDERRCTLSAVPLSSRSASSRGSVTRCDSSRPALCAR
eukprot:4487342-Pleurochrysis_carterae.AAC.2